MRDERHFDFRVLAADALQREEEERFRKLPLRLAHAAGNIDRKDYRGACSGARAEHELPEAQIVIGERSGVLLDGAALDCLLHRAAAVEARAHATLVPSF